MDHVTKAVLDAVEALGFAVDVRGKADAGVSVTATNRATGEMFVVRGEDPYATACELAEQVGIELEDG